MLLGPEGWSAEGAWAPETLSPLEGKEARKWRENISRRLDLGLSVRGGMEAQPRQETARVWLFSLHRVPPPLAKRSQL